GRLAPSGDDTGLPVTLVVPENAFVDADGRAAAGPGTVFVWGYPAGTPIPGDRLGVVAGNPTLLESYGAVDIEVFNREGRRLQLAPGASLQLIMAPAIADPPSTISLFIYD